MRTRVPRAVYALLFLHIAVSLVYQLTAAVSLIVGYFDLRRQVQEPGLVIDWDEPIVASVSGAAEQVDFSGNGIMARAGHPSLPYAGG